MAASRLIAPVGIDSTRTRSVDPIFMMAPLPQFFSIWAIARFSAFFLSSLTVDTAISFHPVVRRLGHGGAQKREQIHTRRNYEDTHNLSRFPGKKSGRPASPLRHHFDASRNAFSMCWTRTFSAPRMTPM